MSTKGWYADSFGEDFFRMYQYACTPERTRLETDNIVHLLNLPRGATVLDLCCGYGRHAIELARRGYKVTGFDLSEVLLQRARSDAERAGVDVQWVQGDMRELQFEAEFDAVINVFNSFGYLESDGEDQRVLERVWKTLKPGGLFLQEIGNRDGFVRTYQPTRVTHLPDELIVVSECEFDLLRSRLHDHITLLYPDGRRTSSEFYNRIYSLTEIAKMLQVAGFEVEQYFGRLDGTELTLDSVFIVTLNRKRWETKYR